MKGETYENYTVRKLGCVDANWIELVTDLAVGFVTRYAVQVLHLMLLQYSNVLYCTRGS